MGLKIRKIINFHRTGHGITVSDTLAFGRKGVRMKPSPTAPAQADADWSRKLPTIEPLATGYGCMIAAYMLKFSFLNDKRNHLLFLLAAHAILITSANRYNKRQCE